MTNSRRRRILFAACAVGIASVLSLAGLLGLDVYVHKRAERSAGLNIWGYRGPAVSRKQPDEIRVVVLGGSTVFGYGVIWDEAFPAQLERRLNASEGPFHFSVVNLGYNAEGSFAFPYTLQDYAYLQPDIVCLYEGYNDLRGDEEGGNQALYRHSSPLFRTTGYMPILPAYLREKAMALRHGSLAEAYRQNDPGAVPIFQPDLARRTTSDALVAAARISESIERQMARLGTEPGPAVVQATGRGCAPPWSGYCGNVAAAIDFALGHGQQVIFVTQPNLPGHSGGERHSWQQLVVKTMLRERYGERRDVRIVNLGPAIDLGDTRLAIDGMHLTPQGNGRVAELLTAPVLEAAANRTKASR